MKKLSFLFVAVALFTFVSLNSCKNTATPEETTEEQVEEVVDEATQAVDTAVAAADTAVVEE